MARLKKNQEQTAEQAAAAARAAQAKAPPAPQPSFWEARALLSDKCSDGMRRKMYFRFHPVATYATGMDVASWLGKLAVDYAARLG